jgi:geranylgeranyl pyrophosphate synthase
LPESFDDRVSDYIERISGCLERALPTEEKVPEQLHQAMRYAVLNGGKRIRPLLVYASGECLGISTDQLDAPATAIEMIHAFSLVHDDLPAMDDDDLRRGLPTVHKKFDEATAILAADALQPVAFQILAESQSISAEKRVALIARISAACGSLGMTGGQAIDLASEGCTIGKSDLQRMYAMKTGALIHAAVMSACDLCDGLSREQQNAMHVFASTIGPAFQIRDDILDVDGETDVIGKTAGSDERLNKATWPSLFGIEAARSRCDELCDEGIRALDTFESKADPLRWVADYIVQRSN